MATRSQNPADAIEIELIRSLYTGFVPSLIMSIGFLICGSLIAWRTGDTVLGLLLIPGALSTAFRLGIARRDATRAARPRLGIEEARRLERRFAFAYLSFALILGLFGARLFLLPVVEAHLLMLALLIGYAAGVAAGVGLRPRVAIPSMVMAVLPPMLAALWGGDLLYVATAIMTLAFLAGGIGSLRGRHARALADIGRGLTFASLARQDALTALPNRLALREAYDEDGFEARAARLVAVHCLDLNGFKPVNDRFGHPMGDALLTLVGKRLASSLRDGDVAARLGGDEFAVFQRNIGHPDEARLLAQRIAATIGRPYVIGEQALEISTCVGYVVSDDPADDLERLITLADEALYSAKRSGASVRRYEPAAGARAAA